MSNFKVRKVELVDLKRYKELTDIEGWNLGIGKIVWSHLEWIYFGLHLLYYIVSWFSQPLITNVPRLIDRKFSLDMMEMAFGTKGTAYCVELIPDGKIVSFCGYFRLSEDANLIITYITDKDYRGMGYGSKCFKGKPFADKLCRLSSKNYHNSNKFQRWWMIVKGRKSS